MAIFNSFLYVYQRVVIEECFSFFVCVYQQISAVCVFRYCWSFASTVHGFVAGIEARTVLRHDLAERYVTYPQVNKQFAMENHHLYISLYHSVRDWGPLNVFRTDTPIHRARTDTPIAARAPIHRYTDCRARTDTPIDRLPPSHRYIDTPVSALALIHRLLRSCWYTNTRTAAHAFMRRYTDCCARTGTPRPRHFVRCGIMERDVIIWIILDISCRYIHIGLSGWVHIGGRGIRLSYKLQAHFFFLFW